MILDIDHFKLVNDQWGHDVGDRVLRHVGNLLREQAREGDILARFGGEEFVALLPDADLEGAQGFADRVRESLVQRTGGLPAVRLSAGVRVGEPFSEITALLAEADLALYDAKRAGRDRTTVFAAAGRLRALLSAPRCAGVGEQRAEEVVRRIDAGEVHEAAARIAELTRRTPLLTSRGLSDACGGQVVLKAENLQRTGSFKLRGAAHRIDRLEHPNGVVAGSAGNHGQSLAYAARARGTSRARCSCRARPRSRRSRRCRRSAGPSISPRTRSTRRWRRRSRAPSRPGRRSCTRSTTRM